MYQIASLFGVIKYYHIRRDTVLSLVSRDVSVMLYVYRFTVRHSSYGLRPCVLLHLHSAPTRNTAARVYLSSLAVATRPRRLSPLSLLGQTERPPWLLRLGAAVPQ